MAKNKRKFDYIRYFGGKHYKPIHTSWFESPAYKALSTNARALLIEIIMRDRLNNGRIVLSSAQAQQALNLSENTIKKAFLQLMEHGFIELFGKESWIKGRAREWRLTFWSCGQSNPTHEWKDWKHKIQNEPSKIENTTSNNKVSNNHDARYCGVLTPESAVNVPAMSKSLKN